MIAMARLRVPNVRKPQASRVRLAFPRITNGLITTNNDFIDAGSFSVLPVDVIHFIMNHLSIRDLYHNLSMGNKALFVLVRSMDLQYYTVDMSTALVSKKTKNQRVLLDAISKINNHDQIRSIIIGKLEFSRRTWYNLHQLMPNLRSIHLKGTRYINQYTVPGIGQEGNNKSSLVEHSKITSFTLESSFRFDIGFTALFMYLGSALEHLELRETKSGLAYQSADYIFMELSTHCSNLKSLKLIGCMMTGLLNVRPTTVNFMCTRCENIDMIYLGKIIDGCAREVNTLLLSGDTILSAKSLLVLQKGIAYGTERAINNS